MNKAYKKPHRIEVGKYIWFKIRYYQNINDIPDESLARQMQVSERTLKQYDKDANCITFSQLDTFLQTNNLTIEELIVLH